MARATSSTGVPHSSLLLLRRGGGGGGTRSCGRGEALDVSDVDDSDAVVLCRFMRKLDSEPLERRGLWSSVERARVGGLRGVFWRGVAERPGAARGRSSSRTVCAYA